MPGHGAGVFPGAQSQSQPTLADVARSAGSEIVSVVEMPADDQQVVAGSVLYDSTAAPAKFPGAVALAIGLSLSGKRLRAKVQELKDAGYVAIVYKTNGKPDAALRAAARETGMALFRASDSVPWNQLAEIMDAAVIPHRQSGRTLVDIRPGDLFDLANTVAAQAGGAIAIADPDQTILAYSTLPDQPIDETRRSSILRLHVPHSVQTDKDYRRVHAASDALDVATEDPRLRRTAIAIRAGGAVLGSLWLLERAEHHNKDANRILREAANVAALHILHKRTTYVSTLTRQMDLVKPLLFEPERAELAAIRLGISAASVRVAALSVWPADAIAAETLQSRLRLFDTIRTACAIRLPSAVCGLSDGIVYIVLPQSTESSLQFQRGTLLKIVQNARRLLARPVLAALGAAATIDRLTESRVNAELVLSELVRNVVDGRIAADSDDVVADDESLGSRLQLRQIASSLTASGQLPGTHALRIAEYDEHHKKSFEETIYAYLSCGGNAVEAAKALDVHVNTVRYRLARVQALFGIDVDDPETRLLLWLQLWARHNR
ncbi:DNA-binding PucR family transcriptional regulator [Arthrobacter sp. PvP102]|uniref:PucR family transcriptional regulator n=1 Tax=unclassified Arthrobacter TaxID=235627 RepID=UPI001AE426BB|nr:MULTISPECIES: helix-turn-helix domain-containing protein [unclassified Arthrobacter]MBP1234473.1 DNA-binding PucR family transcriptional regulator [Arthrobacter sp. PvP103]MBP1239607.1 DNA-binding PucR family transcriptional regulator [Arthrobacter sp. PvP102]